jgi:hypothetical protein
MLSGVDCSMSHEGVIPLRPKGVAQRVSEFPHHACHGIRALEVWLSYDRRARDAERGERGRISDELRTALQISDATHLHTPYCAQMEWIMIRENSKSYDFNG